VAILILARQTSSSEVPDKALHADADGRATMDEGLHGAYSAHLGRALRYVKITAPVP
jgi:hypothetical protein